MPMVSKKLVDCMESDICRGLCGCSCMEYEAYPNEEFVVCCDPRRVGKEHTLLCGKRSWSYPAKLQVGPDWPVVMLVYSLMVCVYVPVLYLIYTYVRIYILLRTYMYIYMDIYIYIHYAYTRTHTHADAYAYTNTCIDTYAHLYTFTCTLYCHGYLEPYYVPYDFQ